MKEEEKQAGVKCSTSMDIESAKKRIGQTNPRPLQAQCREQHGWKWGTVTQPERPLGAPPLLAWAPRSEQQREVEGVDNAVRRQSERVNLRRLPIDKRRSGPKGCGARVNQRQRNKVMPHQKLHQKKVIRKSRPGRHCTRWRDRIERVPCSSPPAAVWLVSRVNLRAGCGRSRDFALLGGQI